MTTPAPIQPASEGPFLFRLLTGIDQTTIDDAIASSKALRDAYDPSTQTSNLQIFAGSSLTYSDTHSGFMNNSDDHVQSDT
jgi:hypothetical protein